MERRDFARLMLASAFGANLLSLPTRIAPGARLSARPKPAKGGAVPAGAQPLGLGKGERDGQLFVPRSYQPGKPVPLVLALHGATGSSRGPIRMFSPLADELGFALLVPESRGRTWDAIMSDFGTDRDFIDQALDAAWGKLAIEPTRIGVVGFSDGATYALALGRANGDLFHGIAAFSPGFLIPVDGVSKPPIFISHGRQDSILPIDSCSRRIVPELQRMGYAVTYKEFDGDHEVPPEMARAGLAAVTAK